jgi:hypothetical protein
MDVNKDGNVTWAEKQAYLVKHPDSDNDGDTDSNPDASSSGKLDVLA